MSVWSRIANVFRGDRVSDEIREEFQSHLEEAGRDLRVTGWIGAENLPDRNVHVVLRRDALTQSLVNRRDVVDVTGGINRTGHEGGAFPNRQRAELVRYDHRGRNRW